MLDIDKSVAELEAELSRLKLRKSQILASQALITRVPSEILSRIFELGVHESTLLLPVLSLVSKHWRAVALATPTIWSYIALDHDWGYGRTQSFIRKMKVHFERSQATKLHLIIDSRFVEGLLDLKDIFVELEPHLSRCFSLRLSVIDWDWMTVIRDEMAKVGPVLEELYLRLEPTDTEDQVPFSILAQQCPRLEHVVLEHAPLKCIQADMPRLRRLYLMRDTRYHSTNRLGLSFRELIEKITETPTVEELRIQSTVFFLDGSESVFHDLLKPTAVPKLTSLSFKLLDSTNVSLFLEQTDLPALVRLSVQMEHSSDEGMNWLARLGPSVLSQQRFPSLQHLDLRACNIDGPALVPFVRVLHSLPQLTALALSSPPCGSLGTKIFELLAGGPGATGEWLVPKLQALCVQNCRDVSGHELLRVVLARAGSSVREVEDIRYLKIAQCYSMDQEVLDQLIQLVETVRIL